ncbi:MAG: hypothetical protein KAW01_01280 [Deltaproteobacteria bacterium]|nr:hypothetical protein [Deltaproteobacteria bacterium]
MSTYHSLSRLKKWSFLFFLLILFGGFSTAASSFAACEYMSSGDFSSGSGWTVNDATYWSIVNGMLDAHDLTSTSDYAKRDFYPGGFFSVDVDVDIVNATGQNDRVGVRIRTSGDVFFVVNGDTGEHTTNGVLCYYYPNTGLLKFKVYDFDAVPNADCVVPLAARSVSGTVNSIGLSMLADGVIFRINGQDTNYKLTGDFSWGAYNFIDTLRLYAGGTGLHARFDNVCASPYEVTDFPPGNAMPLPGGADIFPVSPAAAPVINIDPAQANPFGFGSAASGGATLSLSAGISGVLYPVDLYVGLQSDLLGPELWLFTGYNSLQPFSSVGLVPWQANTTGGLNSAILGDIPVSLLPAGTYNFYFFMTPAGRLDAYRLWAAPLVIGGGSSVVTDKAMRDEIKQNIDLIFGITSGFTGGLEELTEIFDEENVVSISPELDLMGILNGAPIPSPITITADFGSGYRMESGSVMSGNAQIELSNVKFGQEEMGADFSATFNNVMKNGAPFANGQISGGLRLTKGVGDQSIVSGQIDINNLSVSGQQLSGTIGISGTMGQLNLSEASKNTGTVRLTFTNVTNGAYSISSGYVDIISTGGDSVTVTTNLETAAGPVNLNMQLTTTANDAMVINTTAPGAAGPYTLSMNNVTLDQESCANYPTAGTISFTSSSTGKTGVVTFTGACDGSYGYSER